jgi:uncharacterized protein (DUF1015 family)
VEEIKKEEIEQFMSQQPHHIFVLYANGQAYGLQLKDKESIDDFLETEHAESYKELDVVIVREILFKGILKADHLKIDEDIYYIRWIKDVLKTVDEGKAKTAVIMNPTLAKQVLDTSKKHERMPQKSTDFYPKMISGLVMQDISAGEKLL